MLSRLKVEHYKSLFDVEVRLEPLTVFIGPNGSGKSNICEALAIVSSIVNGLFTIPNVEISTIVLSGFKSLGKNHSVEKFQPFFWHGYLDYLHFGVEHHLEEGSLAAEKPASHLSIRYESYSQILELSNSDSQEKQSFQHSSQAKDFLITQNYSYSNLASDLNSVKIYDFSPISLNSEYRSGLKSGLAFGEMSRVGQGFPDTLANILLSDRERFDELEKRLTQLVPNIKRISLRNNQNQFSLELVDRYSDHRIPASEISDGTLRILAFLASLYQIETPSIICFEEIENGVHPWLLHKMIELLKLVSTEGINGKPVQVLITTHSPVLLDYVEPKQVRAVELDTEGKTQVHELPIESKAFQKALDAYDGALGELWFTNVFGGNPV
jgi:predicted ATPase